MFDIIAAIYFQSAISKFIWNQASTHALKCLLSHPQPLTKQRYLPSNIYICTYIYVSIRYVATAAFTNAIEPLAPTLHVIISANNRQTRFVAQLFNLTPNRQSTPKAVYCSSCLVFYCFKIFHKSEFICAALECHRN